MRIIVLKGFIISSVLGLSACTSQQQQDAQSTPDARPLVTQFITKAKELTSDPTLQYISLSTASGLPSSNIADYQTVEIQTSSNNLPMHKTTGSKVNGVWQYSVTTITNPPVGALHNNIAGSAFAFDFVDAINVVKSAGLQLQSSTITLSSAQPNPTYASVLGYRINYIGGIAIVNPNTGALSFQQ